MRYLALLFAAGLLTAAEVSFTEKEIALGKALAKEVEREYPPSRDAEARDQIARLGLRLAQAAGSASMTFQLVGTRDAVAGGLPGGYVYVSEGILARAESEDELAAVLAHQVAHVAARHGLDGQRPTAKPPEAPPAIMYRGWLLGACPLSGLYVPLGIRAQQEQYEKEADALAAGYLQAAGYDPQAAEGIVAKIATRRAPAAPPPGTPPPSLRTPPARGTR